MTFYYGVILIGTYLPPRPSPHRLIEHPLYYLVVDPALYFVCALPIVLLFARRRFRDR